MQGPAGSEVCWSIDRRGRELTFRIKRERFEVKTVEGRLLEDGYGYVKIRMFSSNTDASAGRAARAAERQGEGG